MDMASITAAVTGLKTATDIAVSLVKLKSSADVQAKIMELQGIIVTAQASAIAAQSDQFSLLEQIRSLKGQIANLEAWDAEKQRYELKRVYTGAFAYVLKPNASDGEPPHWLCAACYQKGRKSILQEAGRQEDRKRYRCSSCQAEILVFWKYSPDSPYPETSS
jgi:hypothetical protein